MSGSVARDRGAVPALDELMRETPDVRFDALADALGSTRNERARHPRRPHVRDVEDPRRARAVRRRGGPAHERTSFL
jgi:hypothetical protein